MCAAVFAPVPGGANPQDGSRPYIAVSEEDN